jgi:hypothetical protein
LNWSGHSRGMGRQLSTFKADKLGQHPMNLRPTITYLWATEFSCIACRKFNSLELLEVEDFWAGAVSTRFAVMWTAVVQSCPAANSVSIVSV